MLIIYLFSFPKSCRYTQFYTKWWFHVKKYLHHSELVTSVKLVWNLTGPILGTPMDSGIYITQHFETTSFLSNSSTKYKKKRLRYLLVPFTTTQKGQHFFLHQRQKIIQASKKTVIMFKFETAEIFTLRTLFDKIGEDHNCYDDHFEVQIKAAFLVHSFPPSSCLRLCP